MAIVYSWDRRYCPRCNSQMKLAIREEDLYDMADRGSFWLTCPECGYESGSHSDLDRVYSKHNSSQQFRDEEDDPDILRAR